MLILAGVSINAIIGEDGILSKAQDAVLTQRMAQYLEEFQMYKTSEWIEQGINDEVYFYASGEELKKIIPSMLDTEIDDFCVLSGQLTYLGTNPKYQEMLLNMGFYIASSSELSSAFAERVKGYIEELENTKNTDTAKATYLASKDSVTGSFILNYIPSMNSNDRDLFEIQYGTLVYVDVTNPENQLALSTAAWTKGYLSTGKFAIDGYVAPADVEDKGSSTTSWGMACKEYKEIGSEKYWKVIEEDGKLTIVEYNGPGGTIVIPDELVLNGEVKAVGKIDGYGKNIFFKQDGTMLTESKIKKVAVADDIASIVNYGLSKCGDNVQVHILYDKDANLDLGNGPGGGPGNGIVGSCGSLIFVAPSNGTYKMQLWGASGAEGYGYYSATKGSMCGLGGYSEGTMNLNAGEKLYVYIGGKGLIGTADPDNPSGGYNGGGAGLYVSGHKGYGGGGGTDIRYGGTIVTQNNEDYRILVAGGGGGADNPTSENRGSHDDGTGGCGGGTINNNKSSWSGLTGLFDGATNVWKSLSTASHLSEMRFELWYYTKSVINEDEGIIVSPAPGGWDSNEIPQGAIYSGVTREIAKLYGGNATTKGKSWSSSLDYADQAGGGGGYYGGEGSVYNNGGAAGGSAYADTSKVTITGGYCGYTVRTETDQLKGNYGNGECKITKIN